MSDPAVSPAYRKQALRLMLEQTDGWKVVLDRIFLACKEADGLVNSPQWGSDVRLDAIGKKNGLLLLVDWVYREADLPSPFGQHYARLLTALKLTPPPDEDAVVPEVVPPSAQQLAAEARQQRRRAGGVA